MESLPVEIVDVILDEVQSTWCRSLCKDCSLASLAWISESWMTAVEARTFKEIKVYSDNLIAFKQAFDGSCKGHARRLLVNKITLEIVLPEYPD